MPHPAIITYLCIKGGVTFNRDEKERCPKTPPLTLTTITKPSSNKGKGKLKEIEEKGRRVEHNEQALALSLVKIRNERQGSASPDWLIETNTDAHQRKHGENSRQQSSNSDLMDMLRKMEHKMQERDAQLKIQLEMRDQYLEAKIRRKYQYMHELIK